MAGKLPVGWVRIYSTDPPISVTARLSDARPNVTAGYGGWTEVTRPRRRPLSVWVGSPALRLDLPILLDRFRDGASVERQISQLEQLATPSAADGEPPRVRFAARGAAVPHQGRLWVIDSLTWGDTALMNTAGDRTRQQVTLGLMEYIVDVRVGEDSAAIRNRRTKERAKTKAGAPQKRIVASHGRASASHSRTAGKSTSSDFGAGEDLLSIASRLYGDADRWPEIAQANGIRDPRSITPGQVLRLP
jgi:hypothetical protein